MTDRAHRHATGSPEFSPLIAVALGLGVLIVIIGDAAAQLGAHLDGWHRPPPVAPLSLALELADGKTRWPPAATAIAAVAGGILVLAVAALLTRGWRSRSRRSHADRAAPMMGRGRDIHPVSRKNARATAKRFSIVQEGLPIARAVSDGQPLFATWEDQQCDIWGPRRGKTATRAIPPSSPHPPPHSRPPTSPTSTPPPAWSASSPDRSGTSTPNSSPAGNPAGGGTRSATSPPTAARLELTDAFVGAYRDPDARPDPFFDPAGQELVANLLRAAALDKRPITQTLLWSTRPTDDEPAQILQEHGLELAAASVLDHVHSPFEQRGGVFGTARQILAFLRDPEITRWVTPASRTERRAQLDLAEFVQSTGTLYLHSKEGQGSSAGLVTALAMALCDAAEQHAKRSPGGRLAVPLVGVLDEAANICRWRQLPDLYSHYGSRGICLLTLLQSWSQGVQVWGPNGMRKLWGAANIRVYGGGVGEPDFLSNLEKLIGEYNRVVASPSHQRTHTGTSQSTSWQLTPTPILTMAELAALPRDRAVVLPSGAPAVLARPIPGGTRNRPPRSGRRSSAMTPPP